MATLEKVKKAKGKSPAPPPPSATKQQPKGEPSASPAARVMPMGPVKPRRSRVSESPQAGPSVLPSHENPGRPASSASQRSTKRNAVEPIDQGSMVSLGSKHAWEDPEATVATPHSRAASLMGALSKRSSKQNMSAVMALSPHEAGPVRPQVRRADNRSLSTQSLAGPKMESQPYVPFLYARNCLTQVVEDMKKMKNNHLRIVNDIEFTYRAIEDETQAQFNKFVTGLRDQYSQKVYTFRQVIDVHRIELNQKQQYWDEALMSLSVRNKQLLLDKKKLLIQNKTEFERLEGEKGYVSSDLSKQLDAANAELKATKIELENNNEEKAKKDEENKALQEENEQLRQDLAEVMSRPPPITAQATLTSIDDAGGVAHGRSPEVDKEPVIVVTDLSAEERQRMDSERSRMQEERDALQGERLKMDEERDKFAETRRQFQEDQIMLQGELNNANKDRAEWQARYDSLHGQLGDLAELRAKYEALQAQMAAVSLIAAASSPEEQERVQTQLVLVQQDRDLMMEEKRTMEEDHATWEAEFKRQNGHDPTDHDKPDSIRELEVSLEEANNMVTNLDVKIETLETLKEGNVPEAPVIEPRPITVVEPEIRTVEVSVPDPVVVAQLNETQTQVGKLRKELSNVQAELLTVQGEVSKCESELSASEAEVSRLKAELEATREQVLVAVGKTADLENNAEMQRKLKEQERDYEQKLKEKEQERKVTERDFKKMLKAAMKKSKAADSTELQRLLEIMVKEVRGVHLEVSDAGVKVAERLKLVKAEKGSSGERVAAQQMYDQWCHDWSEEHHKQPTAEERSHNTDGRALYSSLESAMLKEELAVTALTMIHTGEVPEKLTPKKEKTTPVTAPDTSEKVSDLEDKVTELEEDLAEVRQDKDDLEVQNKDLEDKIIDLEHNLQLVKTRGVSVPTAAATISASGDEIEELNRQLVSLQEEIDAAEAKLAKEKSSHEVTRDELDTVKEQLAILTLDLENQRAESEVTLEATVGKLQAEIEDLKQKLAKSQARVEELEKARLANLPVDAAKELAAMKVLLVSAEQERDHSRKDKATVEAANKEVKAKMASIDKQAKTQKAGGAETEKKLKELKAAKDKEIKALHAASEKKEKDRQKQEQKKVAALEKKIQQLEISGAVGVKAGGKEAKGDVKGADKAFQEQLVNEKKINRDNQNKIKQLENELKQLQRERGAGAGDTDRLAKKHEKILKELEKKLDAEKKKNDKNVENLKLKSSQLEDTDKNLSEKEKECIKLQNELASLGIAAKEGVEAAIKVKTLEKEVKQLNAENITLTENFNSERVLRKKYYNMVEDMKGKIRVYCRVRPMSKSEMDRGSYSVVKSPDEYSLNVDSNRGLKEFQYDQVFMPEASQEKVFEDTNNLIQSAVDGYNVCIFAYGQTGSGKTFTIIGDKAQTVPGIAPRAFDRIFELLEENKTKFSYKVQVYMLELYNDKLLDLFSKTSHHDAENQTDDKMEIKKDKKGMVVIQGADIKQARNGKELMALFEEGSVNRHTASTKMNAESSRSHLVVGIIIETTNRTTGTVMKGKLSLVDLAGSERAAKTGASAEQLKEAMSINKSLSALGDVISALSSEQSFIPYRNNKLTMLMQDSLGGNAKTLMFVNVSPADYNTDETVVSLTYASRVKLITNDASKNADNKEISRLKGIIAKMKKGDGEAVVDEED